MESSAPARDLLIHYNEIALKGKNRRYFEDRLIAGVRRALAGIAVARVKRLQGRILAEFALEIPWDEVRRRLSRVFGVSHFGRAHRAPLDLEAIRAALAGALAGRPSGGETSFAIISRRPNKRFPLNSMELNRELGRFVQESTGWRVSIDAPQVPIYVSILEEQAFIAFERCGGPGGLPAGAGGRVACLISGGIDSPVAAHRLMRRGSVPVFTHFHSFPLTSRASIDKVEAIVAALLRDRGRTRLWLIPFADLQRRIVAECPAPYRVLLYRRFMLRAAEAVALREEALALVTGDSLGQVASQTLENLTAIEAAVSIPVLRPLVGMDKLEIVKEAEAIGTFGISIEPHDDCCGLLMPRNPATRARAGDLEAAERPFNPAAEVEALLAAAEVRILGDSA